MSSSLVQVKISGQTFTIPRQYTPVGVIGKGSYGVVASAERREEDGSTKKVAIKRLRPMAKDSWDARHTLREIRIMRLIGWHPNVIDLVDLSLNYAQDELYIYMELMDSDLHRIIQSRQELSSAHISVIIKQVIYGVQALHKCNLLHRDLKPGNILVSRDCQVRITDFGLARSLEKGNQGDARADAGNNANPLTEYVVTRWYRCPELLLAPQEPYSFAIDMWSIGCILGELLKRKPLFPGKNYAHQLTLIIDVLGTPDLNEGVGFNLTSQAAKYLRRLKKQSPVAWTAVIPKAAESPLLELMDALLQFNPSARPSADEALLHPSIANARHIPVSPVPPEETMARASAESVDFNFDRPNVALSAMRQLITGEVELLHRKRWREREARRREEAEGAQQGEQQGEQPAEEQQGEQPGEQQGEEQAEEQAAQLLSTGSNRVPATKLAPREAGRERRRSRQGLNHMLKRGGRVNSRSPMLSTTKPPKKLTPKASSRSNKKTTTPPRTSPGITEPPVTGSTRAALSSTKTSGTGSDSNLNATPIRTHSNLHEIAKLTRAGQDVPLPRDRRLRSATSPIRDQSIDQSDAGNALETASDGGEPDGHSVDKVKATQDALRAKAREQATAIHYLVQSRSESLLEQHHLKRARTFAVKSSRKAELAGLPPTRSQHRMIMRRAPSNSPSPLDMQSLRDLKKLGIARK
uniref:Protein kinase domain-containing protein n=1 Tax=Phaeomonas parva TaxID=124430 RepID=A0A7S1TTR8_9STRA|mmetsp:Transcript_17485/g.53524  ORF Transcript_17485/g.53524 Transcript_17485/m.53524 type:complete len:695 (+) Transcript_17485:304-2388(+)|eukprot:CAMPEP_0118860530 /NCGR_PEP_ID=MMETSP1163-20130328/6349_1 /TAXON_ID=124430 /ORGANISM="Phaeomonas parva, Strain CCMP2877" /LENGTH=694 /DNA_ID=CAMNT_0006794235 /DNA_START=177 /DNA_END=2261 /DNA_ORIENTATION=+